MSETVGPSRRGRPLGRWKDRVKEYMCVREVLLEGGGWIKQGGGIYMKEG